MIGFYHRLSLTLALSTLLPLLVAASELWFVGTEITRAAVFPALTGFTISTGPPLPLLMPLRASQVYNMGERDIFNVVISTLSVAHFQLIK